MIDGQRRRLCAGAGRDAAPNVAQFPGIIRKVNSEINSSSDLWIRKFEEQIRANLTVMQIAILNGVLVKAKMTDPADPNSYTEGVHVPSYKMDKIENYLKR